MSPVHTTAPLTSNVASTLHGNSAPLPRPVVAAPPVATAAGHGVGGQLHVVSYLPASSSYGPCASQAPVTLCMHRCILVHTAQLSQAMFNTCHLSTNKPHIPLSLPSHTWLLA
ncbi:unnamed protein product [Meganyctiphanes norvegica]|uniref:Uncharacterized protein n=1 Tax=Meganyctiphanes norvegica TaxID=48144 RepID=A0AAV2R846_MEGNR